MNGARGRAARPDGISGNNLFAVAGTPTPIGTLSAFVFVVDQNEEAVQQYRLSSASVGVRLAGSQPVGGGVTLSYVGSWARQGDHGRNPNRYRADFLLVEGAVTAAGLTTTLGYEVLGADDGLPLTSFQTPLSSLFKFQGWADKFTIAPADGIRDLYGTVGYGWRAADVPVAMTAAWHRFESDRLVRHYGDEWNLLVTARSGSLLYAVRYAHYRADQFAADTDKLWLSIDWAL